MRGMKLFKIASIWINRRSLEKKRDRESPLVLSGSESSPRGFVCNARPFPLSRKQSAGAGNVVQAKTAVNRNVDRCKSLIHAERCIRKDNVSSERHDPA